MQIFKVVEKQNSHRKLPNHFDVPTYVIKTEEGQIQDIAKADEDSLDSDSPQSKRKQFKNLLSKIKVPDDHELN
jgi:hypothetical protein